MLNIFVTAGSLWMRLYAVFKGLTFQIIHQLSFLNVILLYHSLFNVLYSTITDMARVTTENTSKRRSRKNNRDLNKLRKKEKARKTNGFHFTLRLQKNLELEQKVYLHHLTIWLVELVLGLVAFQANLWLNTLREKSGRKVVNTFRIWY